MTVYKQKNNGSKQKAPKLERKTQEHQRPKTKKAKGLTGKKTLSAGRTDGESRRKNSKKDPERSGNSNNIELQKGKERNKQKTFHQNPE